MRTPIADHHSHMSGQPMDEQMSGTDDAHPHSPREKPVRVLVYSHDGRTRAAIRLAIGRRPATDVSPVEIIECATEPALFRRLDDHAVDIMVLDGEAQPAGGMGVCRQAKDEIYNCPPVLLVIGRPDDGWLATWSGADAVVSHPIDPRVLAAGLAGLMRRRAPLARQ